MRWPVRAVRALGCREWTVPSSLPGVHRVCGNRSIETERLGLPWLARTPEREPAVLEMQRGARMDLGPCLAFGVCALGPTAPGSCVTCYSFATWWQREASQTGQGRAAPGPLSGGPCPKEKQWNLLRLQCCCDDRTRDAATSISFSALKSCRSRVR